MVLYVCTHSSTVLRYDTVLLEYTTYSYDTVVTVPALFTRFGRAETVPPVLVRARGILFEIQYGTRTVQYSTVAYSYEYKYKQERGLTTVHCGTVPVP